MPKLCFSCLYHAADPAPDACPKCGRPLKLTLLPPPGVEPEPVPGVPTTLTHRYGNNPELVDAEHATPPSLLSGYVNFKYRGLVVLAAIAVVVLFVLRIVTTR